MSLRYGFLALVALFCVPLASAQVPLYTDSTTSARLRGALQFRFSALQDEGTNTDRVGFGVRRARLLYDMDIGERTSVFVQLEGQGPVLFDARVSYDLTSRLRLSGGRFVSAQPAAFTLTPFFQLDAVERAFIGRLWGARTISADGRDFGVEALYSTEALDARLFLHNGDGSWDRLRGNLREDIGLGPLTGGVEGGGLAVSGAVAWRPPAVSGLDVGGYAGYNGSENANTAFFDGDPGRDYVSASAHVYWGRLPGSQPVRLKADALVIDYAENGIAPNERAGGVSLLGAVRPTRGAELFARGEWYQADLDARGERYEADLGASDETVLVTAGGSVSISSLIGAAYHKARVTGGWVSRLGDEEDALPGANGVIVQAQLMF